jgi:hypothetical protein
MKWTEKASGETLHVTTAAVLDGDPKESGIVAFSVCDKLFVPLNKLFVPLKKPGAGESSSRTIGTVGGWRATGQERVA